MIDKSFFKDTLTQVIASLVVTFLTATAGWIFWDQVVLIYKFISTPITIPAYFPFLSFLSGVSILYLSYKVYQRNKMTYKDYRKDEFFGLIFKWEYEPRKNVYNDSIKAICPKCKSRMTIYEFKMDNDRGTKTSINCNGEDCVYSSYQNKEHNFEFAGGKEVLFHRLSTKVDQELRKRGLKL